MLMIPFIQMFEYILRYWSLDMAKSLENNCRVCVVVWNVTEENVPKKYEGGSVRLRKLNNDDFSLWCIELFKDRGLSDGDEIGLYWDPRSPSLMFKLLSQIKKKITHDEVIVGKLVIPFFETFEYIFLYWTLDMAKSLENGCDVPVDVWDVTEENVPKKYRDMLIYKLKQRYAREKKHTFCPEWIARWSRGQNSKTGVGIHLLVPTAS
ncbi:hypothetical protein MTR67_024327 [Solanum verrucosum]|uniref:Uncharacterized protein n=1 Tax=Solanum verrucosum TaxID=315347 RepID=A0AAF0QV55_SOLVR|nr:hypothetical protein MTR67_024327 [Solanum verrucosum]